MLYSLVNLFHLKIFYLFRSVFGIIVAAGVVIIIIIIIIEWSEFLLLINAIE